MDNLPTCCSSTNKKPTRSSLGGGVMPREDWSETTPEKIFGSVFPHGQIKTVLDVGCGLSVKSQYIECDWITALDIHWPYLRQARWQAIRKNITYVHANAMSIDDLFLPESFDLVLLQ